MSSIRQRAKIRRNAKVVINSNLPNAEISIRLPRVKGISIRNKPTGRLRIKSIVRKRIRRA